MKHALSVETLKVESFSTASEVREEQTAQQYCPTFCFTECRTACSCPVTW